jgi:hypothetical protein
MDWVGASHLRYWGRGKNEGDPIDFRCLRLGGERPGEEAEGEGGCERSAYGHHAATVGGWLSTAAIFRQPLTLRNLIGPLATLSSFPRDS